MKRGSDSRNEKRQAALRVAPVPGQLGRYAAMRRLRPARPAPAAPGPSGSLPLSASGPVAVRPEGLPPRNAGWPGWPLAGDRAGRRVGYRPALGGAGTAAAAGGPAVFVVLLLPLRDGPRTLSVTRPSVVKAL